MSKIKHFDISYIFFIESQKKKSWLSLGFSKEIEKYILCRKILKQRILDNS